MGKFIFLKKYGIILAHFKKKVVPLHQRCKKAEMHKKLRHR